MKKLSEIFKKLWAKFNSFSKVLKIAIIVAVVACVVAIASLMIYSSSNKYSELYSNLDANDAQVVIAKLDEQKIDKKVQGNSILVPTEKVDELRMQLASQLSNGSKGYELLDEGSSFGMTDQEFDLKKKRIIEGNLTKAINSLNAVENAFVTITPAEKSVFAKESKEGKANVVIKLKPGKKIEDEQVESIVRLVSTSTSDVPSKNVEVVDTNANLLTKNLNSEDGTTGVSSETIQKQKDMQTRIAKKYEEGIVKSLEKVVGKDKVSATVNVELDFDSVKTESKTIDPNKVIVSQQTTNEYNNANGNSKSQSPVDNNMSNTIDETTQAGTSGKKDQKTNYETGSTSVIKIDSPGKTKRITASVFIDGKLSGDTQAAFKEAVENAISVDKTRGDSVSVLGMEFDSAAKEEAQAQIDAFNAQVAAAERNKLIIWAVIGSLTLAGIIALVVILIRRRKKTEDKLLDVVIDDAIPQANTQHFAPINFEENNEKMHLEKEIKEYAKDKPDQVVDIIKSWMAENER